MNERERELMALFILGAALGFVAISLAEAWIVASDLADRARIRQELARWYAELARDSGHTTYGVEQGGRRALTTQDVVSPRIDAGETTGDTLTHTPQAAS
jgi:hypothetical protein